MRFIHVPVAAAAALVCLTVAAPASAQGFGLGGRLSMIRPDNVADSVRFWGGQMRAHVSPRTAVELSIDVRTTSNDTLTQRVRDIPIQASLLLFPIRAPFAPYVLGGGGWYSHRVELLAGDETLASSTTREFGWHGGFGAELQLGRHAGLHADYRYTFLHYGNDDDEPPLLSEGPIAEDKGGKWFLPYYRGSMWTAGFTVYF